MINIHKNTPDGDGSDVLVFLTGQDEIEDLASLLKRYLEDLKNDDPADQNVTGDIVQNIKGIGTSINSGHLLIVNGVMICVLYASLPPEQQMLAFRPKPEGCSRKVILATNIAGKWRIDLEASHLIRAYDIMHIIQLVTVILPQRHPSHLMASATL